MFNKIQPVLRKISQFYNKAISKTFIWLCPQIIVCNPFFFSWMTEQSQVVSIFWWFIKNEYWNIPIWSIQTLHLGLCESPLTFTTPSLLRNDPTSFALHWMHLLLFRQKCSCSTGCLASISAQLFSVLFRDAYVRVVRVPQSEDLLKRHPLLQACL